MAKKRKKGFWLVIAALSVSLLAGLGAYKGSRLLADEITTDAEKQAEKAGLFKPADVESKVSSKLVNEEKTVNKLRPKSLIYVVNFETGKVEKLAVQVFDTVSMAVTFVYFDMDITYTMTGTLYRALANGNVLVPQTVTISELYSYYGNESAFEAGRKILSEMLGTDIEYYIALSKENAPDDFVLERVTALGLKELYGKSKGRDTNLESEEEEVFENLSSYIEDSAIKGYEAPVIRRNESCFVDVTGVWSVLQGILPED